jgi:hypothetical protein
VIRIQPEGGVHDVGEASARARVAVGDSEIAVCVSVAGKPMVVAVGVGKLSGKVGGIWVGVAGGGRLSARDK